MTPLSCGLSLTHDEFAGIRRRMMLEFCKWDPQVEDVSTLCPYPLLLTEQAWQQLKDWSEMLAEETLAAEAELLTRPDLLKQLGLPRAVFQLVSRKDLPRQADSSLRIMRFDFHWTTEGWRISEVNSDVPGGFIEASAFTQLMQKAVPGTTTPGDPAGAYAAAIAQNGVRMAGLVHATAYSDDRQVMIYLSRRLQQLGVDSRLVSPNDVSWPSGGALLKCGAERIPAEAIVRFYPGEWLPNLGRRAGWSNFFGHLGVHLSNSGTALVSQSKRMPIVWDKLSTQMNTWRTLLPETRDPRQAAWRTDDRWVLKPALGRVGESIGLHGVTSERDWRSIRRNAAWWPSRWIVQRRFELIGLQSPVRTVFPVIGVYTIGRTVAGIYARLAPRPLIDHLAQDAAVLIPQTVSSGVPVMASSGFDERTYDHEHC